VGGTHSENRPSAARPGCSPGSAATAQNVRVQNRVRGQGRADIERTGSEHSARAGLQGQGRSLCNKVPTTCCAWRTWQGNGPCVGMSRGMAMTPSMVKSVVPPKGASRWPSPGLDVDLVARPGLRHVVHQPRVVGPLEEDAAELEARPLLRLCFLLGPPRRHLKIQKEGIRERVHSQTVPWPQQVTEATWNAGKVLQLWPLLASTKPPPRVWP